jgi:hypothetical protein
VTAPRLTAERLAELRSMVVTGLPVPGVRALADDVLELRRRGDHDRADRLTQRRDALARDAYRRAIRG